jgi:Tfp pilus assembly protein PilF
MNLFASAIAIALLLSTSPGFGIGADTAKQTFEAATQALNSGDYPAAEAGFRKVLELDPRNVSALANLGVLYAKTHRYGKAIEARTGATGPGRIHQALFK